MNARSLASLALGALLLTRPALADAKPDLGEGESATAARVEKPNLDAMVERAASRAAAERRIGAVGGLVGGAALVVGAKAFLDETPTSDTSGRTTAWALLAVGGITLASSPFALFGSTFMERVAAEVHAIPGAPNDPDRLARIDVLLKLAARDETDARERGAWTSGLFGAVFLGLAIREGVSETSTETTRIVRAASFGAGASAAAVNALMLGILPGPVGVVAEDWALARGAGAGARSSRPLAARAPSLVIAPTGTGFAVAGAF